MTNHEFKEKYKIHFLSTKTILKLESNNINMKDIIDSDAKIDFPFFTKEYLESVIKTDSKYLNSWVSKQNAKRIFIFVLFLIFFLTASIVSISSYYVLVLWIAIAIIIGTRYGVIFLYRKKFTEYYLLLISLKNKKFLNTIKNCFVQKPENFPLTVRLLYFPEDIKYLPKHSKLRSPKWLANFPQMNQNSINKNELSDYHNNKKENTVNKYKISIITKRTTVEFNNFIIKFCQYLLDTHYKIN